MLTPHPSSRHGKSRGFSLIEVAIAVSILAVALVALLGLFPAGMTNFRTAMDTSVTAQIAQRILHDMEQAEFSEVVDLINLPSDATSYCTPHFSFRAPTVRAPRLRYFDEQGKEVITQAEKPNEAEKQVIVYHVNTRIIPRAELPTIGETASQVAQVTIQVARNPGNRDIPINVGSDKDPNVPNRNLFKSTTGITIYTFSALIGKNEGK
ncbi:MAG: prepilin-type N-terminal cleavage/methylation domain-containing protein [Chthoniobacteraceae bacterium]